MRFSALVSWSTQRQWQRDFWYIHESYTFVKLAPGMAVQVEDKFPALAEKTSGPSMRDLKWAIQLVPLADIHLRPVKQYEIETSKGNGRAIRFLEVIAYSILVIAGINYINLTSAKRRTGQRKSGSGRSAGHGRSN